MYFYTSILALNVKFWYKYLISINLNIVVKTWIAWIAIMVYFADI